MSKGSQLDAGVVTVLAAAVVKPGSSGMEAEAPALIRPWLAFSTGGAPRPEVDRMAAVSLRPMTKMGHIAVVQEPWSNPTVPSMLEYIPLRACKKAERI